MTAIIHKTKSSEQNNSVVEMLMLIKMCIITTNIKKSNISVPCD